jgi:beta-phosphoglucomutase-like phosphatase (HAD superfamily)
VSSEEVPRGKPAPDVYLEAAQRLRQQPHDCVAIEDSTNGIRSGVAAGLRVIVVPNHDYPPRDDALAAASLVLDNLDEVSTEIVAAL